ncbi:hypothetical protein BaRGS_00005976, partial [Batillaria attramentaria]
MFCFTSYVHREGYLKSWPNFGLLRDLNQEPSFDRESNTRPMELSPLTISPRSFAYFDSEVFSLVVSHQIRR